MDADEPEVHEVDQESVPAPHWLEFPDPPPPRRRGRRIGATLVCLGIVVALVAGAMAVADPPSGTHGFLALRPDGGPVRWNPCQPIHYQLNLEDAPEGALDVTHQAIARLSEVTGLTFVDDGPSDATVVGRSLSNGIYYEHSDGNTLEYYPILIGWIPEMDRATLDMGGDRHAVGFARPIEGTGDLAGTWVSGYVGLDPQADADWTWRLALGPVLLHELAHLVGLAHVRSDPREVMDVSAERDMRVTDYGPGDLEGLRDVGADGGCLAARPVAAGPPPRD